jgi:hypothetical protein
VTGLEIALLGALGATLLAFARLRAGWLARVERAQGEAHSAQAATSAMAEQIGLSTATLDTATVELDERQRRLEKLDQEVSELRGTAQENERKVTEYRNMIEVAQTERNGWKKLYYEESSGHGVAQALLFREVARCAAAARAAGRPLKQNSAVEAALLEHREKHAVPAWNALGQQPAPLTLAAPASSGP